MDTKTLQYFLAIYETRSLHKAAEQLYVSQQGLSKVLISMETEYGAKLFARTSSGLLPTRAGDCLYQESLKLQKQIGQMQSHVRSAATGREEVKIACAFGSMFLMYDKVQDFIKKHPEIWIHWMEFTDLDAERAVWDGDAEIGLIVKGNNEPGLKTRPVVSYDPCVFVYEGHPLYDRQELTIADLAGERIVLEGQKFQLYWLFKKACESAGFFPNIIAETTQLYMCTELVRRHTGIAFSVTFATHFLNMEHVRAIPVRQESLKWELMAAKKESKLQPSAELLWKYITENCVE